MQALQANDFDYTAMWNAKTGVIDHVQHETLDCQENIDSNKLVLSAAPHADVPLKMQINLFTAVSDADFANNDGNVGNMDPYDEHWCAIARASVDDGNKSIFNDPDIYRWKDVTVSGHQYRVFLRRSDGQCAYTRVDTGAKDRYGYGTTVWFTPQFSSNGWGQIATDGTTQFITSSTTGTRYPGPYYLINYTGNQYLDLKTGQIIFIPPSEDWYNNPSTDSSHPASDGWYQKTNTTSYNFTSSIKFTSEKKEYFSIYTGEHDTSAQWGKPTPGNWTWDSQYRAWTNFDYKILIEFNPVDGSWYEH